jgi:predicted unusual protein kinase regulating ubiquinone biosynthesis (AarF/ABC1/UbiB family)
VFGGDEADLKNARALKAALGGLKGPLMKAAQMFATVPDLSAAGVRRGAGRAADQRPAMGGPFVRPPHGRRARPRLAEPASPNSNSTAAHAASLGQVHRATALDGRRLAVKLQYPDMESAVESDLGQLRAVFALYRRLDKSIDPSEIAEEVSERLREELDYVREARNMAIYGRFFAGRDDILVPEPDALLSTRRLLTMSWIEGGACCTSRTRRLRSATASPGCCSRPGGRP